MVRSTRFVRFLDRFDKQLQVDCERMKREMAARVDQQFVVLRAKVNKLNNRCSTRSSQTHKVGASFGHDPSVNVISFEDYIERKREEAAAAELGKIEQNVQSTSSVRRPKRKSQAQPRVATKKPKKKPKAQSSVQKKKEKKKKKKFVCKFVGCTQSFATDHVLARHERIHLNIKPYRCTWQNCDFSSPQPGGIVNHIRGVHFKLPRSAKRQLELNIVDDRNPNDYIQVDQDLINRRLE